MMNEPNDEWTPAQFHAWLIEEAYNFRRVQEGFHYENASETKTTAEWGKAFREWLENNI